MSTGRERRIVAVGGGGFGADPPDLAMDGFVLGLVDRSPARVCFVPTAGGDRDQSIVDFYAAIKGRPIVGSHLTLFRRDDDDIEALLLANDIVWVGGGNTANMLAIWRLHGVDRALRAAWDAGVLLAGVSAGAICWFESGTTDSFGRELRAFHDGLGFLAGSLCPHYDGEPRRRPLYRQLVSDGPPNGLPPGYALDDDVALLFVDRELRDAVTSRRGAQAYRVEVAGQESAGEAAETAIPTRYLGED